MKKLTHVDSGGKAAMVDVSNKPETVRTALARGTIRMHPDTLAAVKANTLKKGDVQTAAKLAGIMAAKRTAELIPLCHTLPLANVDIVFRLDDDRSAIHAEATATASAQTGVEMEALTAVSVALLTIYDMTKAVDRTMVIGDVELLEKRGGRNPGKKTADGWVSG